MCKILSGTLTPVLRESSLESIHATDNILYAKLYIETYSNYESFRKRGTPMIFDIIITLQRHVNAENDSKVRTFGRKVLFNLTDFYYNTVHCSSMKCIYLFHILKLDIIHFILDV